MKGSITCVQAVDYISKKEEGKLSSWKRVQLWRHLAVCSLCKIFSVQNKVIATALADESNQVEGSLSAEDKAAIVSKALADEGK